MQQEPRSHSSPRLFRSCRGRVWHVVHAPTTLAKETYRHTARSAILISRYSARLIIQLQSCCPPQTPYLLALTWIHYLDFNETYPIRAPSQGTSTKTRVAINGMEGQILPLKSLNSQCHLHRAVVSTRDLQTQSNQYFHFGHHSYHRRPQ